MAGSPAAPVRLICFPNAGGSATAFRAWSAIIPAGVELLAVQFPGRQKRIKEPLVRDLREAVQQLLPAVMPLTEVPSAFFGDCAGSLVAYELIQALVARGGNLPRRLVVSCSRAPDLSPRHEPLYGLDDAMLSAKMRELAFAPDWLLDDEPTLKAFLPLLRCDFELAETYVRRDGEPLPVPITAIAGTQDRITPKSDVAGWRAHTTKAFDLVPMAGGHDLAQTRAGDIMAVLADTIANDMPSGSDMPFKSEVTTVLAQTRRTGG